MQNHAVAHSKCLISISYMSPLINLISFLSLKKITKRNVEELGVKEAFLVV